MAQTDRTAFIGNTGIKQPVRAATTGSITLSGEQTIDGTACVSGDRVLVKDQATDSENGIYNVDTGSWSRAKDYQGAYAVVNGTLVRVNEGSTNADGIFILGATDPVTIGSSSLSFSRMAINYVSHVALVSAAGQTVFNVGTPYQIGSSNLAVYVNGIRQRVGDDYAETSTSVITFVSGLAANDEVDCYIGLSLGNLTAAAASLVAVTDAGDFYVGNTVESILQEIAWAISADNGDSDATFNNSASGRVQRWNTPLTANRTLTLATANAKEGACCLAVRGSGATGNFSLAVGALATLRAPGQWALCVYDAGTAAWVLAGYGILPSADQLGLTDVGDADANLTVGTSLGSQRWATLLTADRTADLQTAGAYAGARFHLSRSGGGSFELSVTASGSRLIRLAEQQWCQVEYSGTAWFVSAFGDLRRPNKDVVVLSDDFLGAEIDGYRWQSLLGTDGSARQAVVLADQIDGRVRLTTGADAAGTMAVNGSQLHSALNWRASNGDLVAEGKVWLDSIASVAVFFGLTDQVSALEMPFTLAAGNVLTNNATNAVGVLYDTAADTDNWWLVGVAAGVQATKQNTGNAPAAGTPVTWRIEISATGIATFYANGVLQGTAMSGSLSVSAALTPVVATFSRTNASKNIDVDFINVQQQR